MTIPLMTARGLVRARMEFGTVDEGCQAARMRALLRCLVVSIFREVTVTFLPFRSRVRSRLPDGSVGGFSL